MLRLAACVQAAALFVSLCVCAFVAQSVCVSAAGSGVAAGAATGCAFLCVSHTACVSVTDCPLLFTAVICLQQARGLQLVPLLAEGNLCR
jgi:hypothetical protein